MKSQFVDGSSSQSEEPWAQPRLQVLALNVLWMAFELELEGTAAGAPARGRIRNIGFMWKIMGF